MHRLSARSSPPAVSTMTRSTACRAPGASRCTSPRMRTDTRFSRRLSTSRAMYSSRRLISASISIAGRCQFSWLNANRLSTPTFASRQPWMTSRTAPIPAWWPSGRGSARPLAHRPLPSMMIAMWAGTDPCTFSRCSRSSLMSSDFHDLGFFGVDQAVDLLDVLVGDLLDVLLRPRLVVLGHLLELLDLGHRLGPRVTDGDAPLLRQLVHDLHQLLATLFTQRRQGDADEVALGSGVEPEVGVADGLLDSLGQALVERLDGEQPRLGRRHHGHLVERHAVPVGLDAHDVQQRRAGLAAPNPAELALGALDRLVHQLAGMLGEFGNGGHRTRVPTRSPCSTREMAPGWLMLKTTTGSWLALQSPNALASMTA